MWQKSNETDFFHLPKFLFFSNINVIPFKIVPLGSYTQMETLFPLLVAALDRYGLQHVLITELWEVLIQVQGGLGVDGNIFKIGIIVNAALNFRVT